jgi:hypothetical protein
MLERRCAAGAEVVTLILLPNSDLRSEAWLRRRWPAQVTVGSLIARICSTMQSWRADAIINPGKLDANGVAYIVCALQQSVSRN